MWEDYFKLTNLKHFQSTLLIVVANCNFEQNVFVCLSPSHLPGGMIFWKADERHLLCGFVRMHLETTNAGNIVNTYKQVRLFFNFISVSHVLNVYRMYRNSWALKLSLWPAVYAAVKVHKEYCSLRLIFNNFVGAECSILDKLLSKTSSQCHGEASEQTGDCFTKW